MIEKIVRQVYEDINRNRVQICKETVRDEYRILFYDLKVCCEGSDHSIPLLSTRHNVTKGMTLIYENCKLLFCDYIFNGYGFSQQDFIKQLSNSKKDAQLGKYLPSDFHFK
jgi:hypothetical protein